MSDVDNSPIAESSRSDPVGPGSDSSWPAHSMRAGSHEWSGKVSPDNPGAHRKQIEPWLAALLQAEHVSLLLGSGFPIAIAELVRVKALQMSVKSLDCELSDAIAKTASESAKKIGRGDANLEDQIRAATELIGGLRVLRNADGDASGTADHLVSCEAALNKVLSDFRGEVLETERGIRDALEEGPTKSDPGGLDPDECRRVLGSFLLTFSSRAASRERLHIFTTNYDRLIEYACDLLGLRVLDRFVGRLSPVFRSSRLGIDLHYNPPGIRGEPRYLEGVVRLTKLHGSIDWHQELDAAAGPEIRQHGLSFGADPSGAHLPSSPLDNLMIFPNSAKDAETLNYPYAELFRDFATATCQPNSVLFTYGYGFGDDHINRVLRDMLTIPSTHLAILAYDGAGGRVKRFCDAVGRNEQVTLLMGNHFGDLSTLVAQYLPKPAIDKTTWRMTDLINRRSPKGSEERAGDGRDDASDEIPEANE